MEVVKPILAFVLTINAIARAGMVLISLPMLLMGFLNVMMTASGSTKGINFLAVYAAFVIAWAILALTYILLGGNLIASRKRFRRFGLIPLITGLEGIITLPFAIYILNSIAQAPPHTPSPSEDKFTLIAYSLIVLISIQFLLSLCLVARTGFTSARAS